MNNWQTKSSKIIYENPWMIVREDQVVMPNGKDGTYGYVESKSDSVFVVPVDSEGNTYIVQQERYTSKKTTWEVVAGRTDGDDYEAAAARELLEEAGIRAGSIKILSEVYDSAGLTTFKSAVCLATNLEEVTNHLDENDGIIAARKLPLAEVRNMILKGEITNGPSITAILMVMAHIETSSHV